MKTETDNAKSKEWVMQNLNNTSPRTRRLIKEALYGPAKKIEKKAGPVATPEFAEKVRQHAAHFPHETKIADLIVDLNAVRKCLKADKREGRSTTSDWERFYSQLSKPQKSFLGSTLRLVVRAGFETLGEIRNASQEELRETQAVAPISGRTRPILSEGKATFLKQAFEPLPYEGAVMEKGEWVVFR